ncbi:MAG TPA: PLDc N-terminal domain-containing protein [Candidatus Paceibacterota bacterium]|nr:PLDc N-terminal domain-containing protein [Candidatus Paceibacterota bacterium]
MLRLIFMLPFLLIGFAMFAFWIWMLIDCATKESSEGNNKIVWVIIIALTNWVGAAIYFFVRRPQRIRELGA